MSEIFHVVPEDQHNALVAAAYRKRGYSASRGRRWRALLRRGRPPRHPHPQRAQGPAPRPPLRLRGRRLRPRREDRESANPLPRRAKSGMPTKNSARPSPTPPSRPAIKLADKYGVGMVSVDNAFHYLWGGGYVMEAARRGYIAYTNCTAALAEVVPFGGKFPTLGTNPHSWGFPTTDAIGFPIVIDWATSIVAMGRVQQFKREGKELPPGAAVDAERPSRPPTRTRRRPPALRRAQGLRPRADQRNHRRASSAVRCPPSATAGTRSATTKAPAASSSRSSTPTP